MTKIKSAISTLFVFLHFLLADNTSLALVPQTQSMSEWDENGVQPGSSDEEFVQLDAQAASTLSLEQKIASQASIQA